MPTISMKTEEGFSMEKGYYNGVYVFDNFINRVVLIQTRKRQIWRTIRTKGLWRMWYLMMKGSVTVGFSLVQQGRYT